MRLLLNLLAWNMIALYIFLMAWMVCEFYESKDRRRDGWKMALFLGAVAMAFGVIWIAGKLLT